MEMLVASSVGVLTAGGVYLILRLQGLPGDPRASRCCPTR